MGKVNFGRKKMLPGSDLGCSERCIPGAFQGNSRCISREFKTHLGLSRDGQNDEPWAQEDEFKGNSRCIPDASEVHLDWISDGFQVHLRWISSEFKGH